jgi:(1->4)-alpha-D-glucan 1-alpha-D-glucosylmutase
VFARGDYEPLAVSGPHRDHVIAFARRRGRDAAITVVAKSFAPFSQAGRVWPPGRSLRRDAEPGRLCRAWFARREAGAVPLSALFRGLPAAVPEGQGCRHLEAGA